MSAIAGLIYLDNRPLQPDALQPAVDFLSHYGDDGQRIITSESAIFAHITHYTTMRSKDYTLPLKRGGLLLTGDFRLDNHAALTTQLDLPPSTSDAEILLAAYRKWGRACPEYLLGDFAFAIWDETEKRLFCARDHIGVAPFFYYHAGDVIAFASEIEALLSLPDVPDILDEREVLRFLLKDGLGVPHSVYHTLYQDVHRLPFSHHLTIAPDSVGLQQYWFPEHTNPLHLPDDAAYAERLRHLLREAVRCRIDTPYPIGAHLSGGLDSATAATIAHKLLGKGHLHTFSWNFAPRHIPDGVYSETERIRVLAEHASLSNTYMELSPWALDGDDEDPSLRTVTTISYERRVQALAAEKGIRLMLSGWGGDEFASFNGRGQPARQFLDLQWGKLLNNLKGRNAQPRGLRVLYNIPYNFWRSVATVIMPAPIQQKLDISGHRRASERFIRPDFRAQTEPHIPPEPRHSSGATVPNPRDTQLSLFYLGHIAERMEAWAWTGAQHGITYAYPLADKRIIEFALSIPGEMYFKNGWSRYIFRLAAEPLLPPGFTWNRYGGVKQSPVMFGPQGARLTREIWGTPPVDEDDDRTPVEKRRDQFEAWQSNPWIDVDKLERITRRPDPNRSIADRDAIRRALVALRIYENWRARQND